MRTARTPPHPMFVLPMADDAALALARALHDRGEAVGGLNGSLPAAEVMRRRAGPAAGRRGRGRPAHPALRARRAGPTRRRARVGCGPRPSTTSTSPRSGSTASCTTPTCRPAATPGSPRPRGDRARGPAPPDRGRHLLVLARRGGGAGAPDRRQPAGVRRGPDRPGLHASRAAPEGVRRRGGRRRSRSCSWTPAPASASTPTRPTRRPTASTRPSATGPSSTR